VAKQVTHSLMIVRDDCLLFRSIRRVRYERGGFDRLGGMPALVAPAIGDHMPGNGEKPGSKSLLLIVGPEPGDACERLYEDVARCIFRFLPVAEAVVAKPKD
jgi:hypothetical protein